MRRALLLLALLGAAAATGQAAVPQARIRYLSAEQVYLDAGQAAGFAAGDTLQVLRDGQRVAGLLVVHAAEHSVACRLLDARVALAPGDRVRGTERGVGAAPPATSPAAPARSRAAVTTRPPAAAGRALRGRFGGSISLGWDGFRDDGAAERDYDRLSAQLGLRGENLAGRDLRVELRLRQRTLQRSGGTSADATSEQRLRLYTAAIELGASRGRWHLAGGRLAGGRQSGAGALDGVLLGLRLGEAELGGYYGAMPDWSDEGIADRGSRGGFYLRQRLAAAQWSLEAVGEQLAGESSREYLIAGSSWQRGALTLRERLELDWNRGWRRARSAEAVQVSAFNAGADWRPRPALSLGLRVDSRVTPLDGELRSVPDSLFQEARSSGSSLNLNWRPLASTRLGARIGWRDRDGAARGTAAWGLDAGIDPPLAPSLHLDLRLSGFDGEAASGLNPSAELRRHFRAGHELGLAGGAYLYTPRELVARRNHWLRADLRLALPARAWLALSIEADGGDDQRGQHLGAELGRRF